MAQRGAKSHSRKRSSQEHHQLLPFQHNTKPDVPTRNVNYKDVLTTAVFAQWSHCVKRETLFALIRKFPVPHTLSSEYNIVKVTKLNHANSSSKLYIYTYMVLVYRPKIKSPLVRDTCPPNDLVLLCSGFFTTICVTNSMKEWGAGILVAFSILGCLT